MDPVDRPKRTSSSLIPQPQQPHPTMGEAVSSIAKQTLEQAARSRRVVNRQSFPQVIRDGAPVGRKVINETRLATSLLETTTIFSRILAGNHATMRWNTHLDCLEIIATPKPRDPYTVLFDLDKLVAYVSNELSDSKGTVKKVTNSLSSGLDGLLDVSGPITVLTVESEQFEEALATALQEISSVADISIAEDRDPEPQAQSPTRSSSQKRPSPEWRDPKILQDISNQIGRGETNKLGSQSTTNQLQALVEVAIAKKARAQKQQTETTARRDRESKEELQKQSARQQVLNPKPEKTQS